jgi:predicted nucleic acid-binding protein
LAYYFVDSSALVKLYVQEPGTDRLLDLVEGHQGDRFAVLTISAVEIRSAIRRRQRSGDIEPDVAREMLESVRNHLESRFIRQVVNDSVIDAALELIDRYALRAYDAIQLAGCLTLRATITEPLTFVCSDHQLLRAASSEQLRVLDPAE